MGTDISPGEMVSDGCGHMPSGGQPMGSDDEPPHSREGGLAALADAIREQWQEMDREERALLVYCLQRLHHQVRTTLP
jgi:hypothetical protein